MKNSHTISDLLPMPMRVTCEGTVKRPFRVCACVYLCVCVVWQTDLTHAICPDS